MSKKKCLVWGCGNFFMQHLDWIKTQYDIVGLVDNKSTLWGTVVGEWQVYAPWDIPHFSMCSIVVAVNQMSAVDAIKREIHEIAESSVEVDTRLVEKFFVVSIKEILEKQHDGFWGVSLEGNFLYAIVLKLLAVENYYGLNDYGMKLHRKYVGVTQPGMMYDREKNFIDLIQSFEKDGYQKESPIILNSHGTVYDGTHRLACCLYHKLQTVRVRMINTTFEERKDKLFFKNSKVFSDEEIAVIEERYYQLLQEYKIMERES